MAIPQSQHALYETIVAIAKKLRQQIKEAVFQEAYTLSLHELVMVFGLPDQSSFVIKIVQEHQTCFWWFETTKPLKPSNAQSCFELANGQAVLDVKMHEQNRSFVLKLDSFQFVFKCYDALVNVLLVDGDEEVVDLFRKRIENDWEFKLSAFAEQDVVDDKVIKGYVYKRNHSQYPYYFTLSPCDDELAFVSDNILEALGYFSRVSLSHLRFYVTRQQLLSSKQAELQKTQASLNITQQSISQKGNTLTPEQIGHLLMANLQNLQSGMEAVELFDFYHNQQVRIKLKKDLNGQQNAAFYYKKHKNSFLQEQQLKHKISVFQKRIDTLQNELERIQVAVSMKELRAFVPKEKVVQVAVPYRQFERDGFLIWVGKSAATNDELTMRHAHKNDLWLHAKDVSGSHVLVKWKAGKEFPTSVIEYAASLAAYYSKLKGSKLVPVSYTQRKFVRKPKGAAPGAVVVEKEQVILVEPNHH